MRFVLRLLNLILITCLPLLAQPEFGEISKAELAMVSFEEDPEADAVILYDIGEMEFNSDFSLKFKVRQRIKILTEKGKEYATVNIPYYYKANVQEIEAYSYLPNGQKFELDYDNIAEEQVKSTKNKKFDIPGVEVGSVIEYKYTLYSRYITNLEPWYFQSDLYTKYSEITIYLPPGFSYSTFYSNLSSYNITQSSDEAYLHSKRVPRYSWIGKDIPPIRVEPYMKAKREYYAKILFQLVSYVNPSTHLNFAKTWDDIAKDHESFFEDKMEDSGDHQDFMEEYLKNDNAQGLERAKRIYEYVKNEIHTEYSGGWYSDKDVEDIFNDKKGTASEKNYLLLNLLEYENFEVYPFLISTRNHGSVFKDWPNISQYNRAIVLLKLNKKLYFLDTNDKFCPFGYLPPELDVETGMKFSGEKTEFMKMNPLKFKNQANYSTDIHIEDDGSLSSESHVVYDGYFAVRERNKLEDSDDIDEIIKNKLEEYNLEAEVDTFYYENLDSLEKPVNLTIKYKLIDAAEINDKLIYLSAPFISGMNKNIFVREKRIFPVDYSFPFVTSEELKINFPAGFSINEKPKKMYKRMRNVNYSKLFFPGEDNIICKRRFEITKKQFSEKEYPKLKKIYDHIVESDQDILVLEKGV